MNKRAGNDSDIEQENSLGIGINRKLYTNSNPGNLILILELWGRI